MSEPSIDWLLENQDNIVHKYQDGTRWKTIRLLMLKPSCFIRTEFNFEKAQVIE